MGDQPQSMTAGMRTIDLSKDTPFRHAPITRLPQRTYRRRVVAVQRWDIELWLRITRRIFAPRPARRLADWIVSAYPRAISFLSAVIGPRVSLSEYYERAAVCLRCPHLVIEIPYRRAVLRYYCGPCKCGRWHYSQVITRGRAGNGFGWRTSKALLARATCPHGYWPREDDDERKALYERAKDEAQIDVDVGTVIAPGSGGDGPEADDAGRMATGT